MLCRTDRKRSNLLVMVAPRRWLTVRMYNANHGSLYSLLSPGIQYTKWDVPSSSYLPSDRYGDGPSNGANQRSVTFTNRRHTDDESRVCGPPKRFSFVYSTRQIYPRGHQLVMDAWGHWAGFKSPPRSVCRAPYIYLSLITDSLLNLCERTHARVDITKRQKQQEVDKT